MRARRALAAVLTGFALIGAGVGVAGPASAHSAVVSSVPEDKATVDRGPERVSVTFNEELQPTFPSLTVVGPDGNYWSEGDPVVEGRTVSVAVGELGPVGEYVVSFRVTSADGHPVKDKRTFTLSTPGNGTPGPAVDANGSDSGGGVPLWVFVVGGVVLFGAGVAFALFGGRAPKKR